MRIEELAAVCQEAARDLLRREPRPLPPAVVLPGPITTRVVTLPELPADDHDRRRLIEALVRDEVAGTGTPAYGFVAEAVDADGQPIVLAVFGAQGHPPRITAAPLDDEGIAGEFTPPEPLDPAAMTFLHPLQRAVGGIPPPP